MDIRKLKLQVRNLFGDGEMIFVPEGWFGDLKPGEPSFRVFWGQGKRGLDEDRWLFLTDLFNALSYNGVIMVTDSVMPWELCIPGLIWYSAERGDNLVYLILFKQAWVSYTWQQIRHMAKSQEART